MFLTINVKNFVAIPITGKPNHICIFTQISSMQTILTNTEIEQKINRLAHQIIEEVYDESVVFIGGIHGNGIPIAKRIHEIIEKNTPSTCSLFEISINKDEPWSEAINLSVPVENLKNAFIILVDDVVNSGKTLQFALAEILKFPTKAIKTVTLIDRTHRRFPIKADFVGLQLSTTLKEHVKVDMSENNMKAYLV